MKKTILLLIIIFVWGNKSVAQNNLPENKKLVMTCKVWGFLKYYHPNVANGNYNWDDQLFEILPKVKNSTSKEQFSQVLIDWIDTLGKVKECKKCEQNLGNEYFDENFDLSWLNDQSAFTDSLFKILKNIELNRHQGKKYYVSPNRRRGNIEVKNEVDYKGFDWKDENLRLLTLFRYWNLVEYFFPYKYQTDIKWDEVLNKMTPKFLNSKSELEFHLAILELVVNLNDSHAGFATDPIREFFGTKWFPVRFKIIEGKAIVTGFLNDSLAIKEDLKIGDVLTKIDGNPIEQIIEQHIKYIPASNNSIKLRNAPFFVFRGNRDSVDIEFFREDILMSQRIRRYNFDKMNLDLANENKWEIIENNIALINMSELRIKEVPEMMQEIMNTKGLIIDLRQYPNGTLKSIVRYISSKKVPLYKKTIPYLNYPGMYKWVVGNEYGNDGELIYKGKVALLVNEYTHSQGEYTAMGLQTGDNVTIIGCQTAGADGNISQFELVGGFYSLFTGLGWFYPDGRETQRVGIIPDIEVNQTILGIREGRDEILEKAIEFINE